MSRVCVFCGKNPEHKNLEHVIPQWLLRQTGVYNSVIKDITTGQPFLFGPTFKNFKFPACEKCNSEFSALEVEAQRIVTQIENNQPLSMNDINTLLNWMDKVRIGIWLAMLYSKKSIDDIQPHMFIKDRMGSKDRLLCIEKLTEGKGLMFSGTSDSLFQLLPCAFQLCINNYVFTNASADFLVSKNLGFPYSTKLKCLDKNGKTMVDLHTGLQKQQQCIIPSIIPSAEKVIFYQPIFKNYLHFGNLYSTDYIKNNSIDPANGLGCIFYQNGSRQLKSIHSDKTLIKVAPKPIQESPLKLSEKLIDLQIHIATNFSGVDGTQPQDAQYTEAINRLNRYKQKMILANKLIRSL